MIWLLLMLILIYFLNKKNLIYLLIYLYVYVIINYKLNYLIFFLPLFMFLNWFYHKNLIMNLLYSIFLISAMMMILLNQINLIWLTIEVQSLSLMGLLFYDGKVKFFNLESIFKYFFLSTMSSFMFLLFLIYMNYMEFQNTFSLLPMNMMNLMIILLYMVLLIKLGLAPFHMWVPEMYLGLSFMCMSFLSMIPKMNFFILFMNLPQFNYFYFIILLLSILMGIMGAMNQSSMKKLIAFSGIYSGGIMIMAMLSNNWCYLNSYFYLFNYLLFLSILLFLFLFKQELNFIFDFKLNSVKNFYLFFFLLMVLTAFMGMPPLSGFLTKWMIMVEIIKSNKYFYSMMIILSSMISSFFYLSILNMSLNLELNKFLLWKNIFYINDIKSLYLSNYLICFFIYYIMFMFLDLNTVLNLFNSLLI